MEIALNISACTPLITNNQEIQRGHFDALLRCAQLAAATYGADSRAIASALHSAETAAPTFCVADVCSLGMPAWHDLMCTLFLARHGIQPSAVLLNGEAVLDHITEKWGLQVPEKDAA